MQDRILQTRFCFVSSTNNVNQRQMLNSSEPLCSQLQNGLIIFILSRAVVRIKGGNVGESMNLVNCEAFVEIQSLSLCEDRSRRCHRKGKILGGPLWSSELALPLFSCCSLKLSYTATHAISKNRVMLMSLSCLNLISGSSLLLEQGRGLVSVTLGPEVQVSYMLKRTPNKE